MLLLSVHISELRILDTEANKHFVKNDPLYEATPLTRCYTQQAIRPIIDSETNHKMYFIKVPCIYKAFGFTDLIL